MANSEWTRRKLRNAVENPERAEALYKTLESLEMTQVPELWVPDEKDRADETPRLAAAAHVTPTRHVVILGAGIGGLTTAYLLQKAGYHVTILEAQQMAGGRSKTARLGYSVSEIRDGKAETQTCQFDPGLYINLGPGRLPYHHRRVLNACRELGVELEVYVMSSDANVYRDREIFARAQPRRHIATDTQGYISELLAEAIQKGALDAELAQKGIIGDKAKEKMLELLGSFGDLEKNTEKGTYEYKGSTRSGCKAELSVSTTCERTPAYPLSGLVNSEFWAHKFYQPLEYEWQDTLFQPVGGMDMIWAGFLGAIERANAEGKTGRVDILYGCPVTGIRLEADGVTVTYQGGEKKADYCVSNIPLPILATKVQANFSKAFKAAVDICKFDPTCKVGWQANQRFWESDKNQIYGGISYVSAAEPSITQMWYPSNGYFGAKGTLTGCYNYDQDAIKLGHMAPTERLETAWAQGKQVHPEFEQAVPKEKGISIAWQNVPYQEGGWANWDDQDDQHHMAFTRLLEADAVDGGRPVFSVVGDQVSSLPGWQEGAMMSAEHVVQQILGVRKARLTTGTVIKAPNTRRLVQGR
jgi:monoamine oxidase